MEIDKKIIIKLVQALEDLKKSLKDIDLGTKDNIVEEEYKKIKPILDGALRDFQKLDEGILDFVKRGFKTAKDAVIKIGQKIRDVITKFLKAVFKRFTDTIKNLFQTKPNEALEYLGVEFDVSGIKVFK